MDAHLPNVYFNQCSTPKTRDIKWTHKMSTLINALPRKLVILNGRTFADVCINQCSTQKTRDIKWTHICRYVFNQCSTPKTRDIKWTHICLMSTLINALPRKLVILNGRTFDVTLIYPRKLVILNVA